MKKYVLILSAVATLLPFRMYSQKFEGSQFCPIGYNLLAGKDFKSRMALVYPKLPGNMQNADKIEYILTYSFYDILTRQLMDNLKVYIPPPSIFEDKVKYDQYGFPEVTVQKAIKLSDAKFFFKCQIRVEEAFPNATPQGMVTPGISIQFTLYSKQGYVPIKNIIVNKVMSQAVKAEISLLAGLTSQEIVAEGPTLEGLMKECVRELGMQIEK
ncbi:MAG: hypothetical protein ACPLXM_05140 [Bacteroidales bacterium]